MYEKEDIVFLNYTLTWPSSQNIDVISLANLSLDDLKTIFESVCKDFNAELVEFDGEKDHVHLLINYPPKISIAKLVNSLKGVSSRMQRIILKSCKTFGVICYGVQVIFRAVAAGLLLKLSNNIFSSNKLLFKKLRLISMS